MKIIYSGIKKDGYDPKRGLSFEYNNFCLSLKGMAGVEVIEYPFDLIVEIGKDEFNRRLLELVRLEKPDLFFVFMYTDELDPGVLDEIKKTTKSLAWFADDHWRLHNYSRRWAKHFSFVVTTWSRAPEIYAKYGITNVIRSQWACNPAIFKPSDLPRDIEVSFVGQYNSARGKLVRALRNAGVNVWVRGWRWPDGKLSEEGMVGVFSRSKINLNFNTPPERWRIKLFARLFLRRSVRGIVPDLWNLAWNFRSWLDMRIPQIKARPFEVLACRTFLISGYADDMGRYYKDGEEIVYYDGTTEDLAEKIRYYLPREKEREAIARAGYERTLRDHTYQKRFEDIFKQIGLRFRR